VTDWSVSNSMNRDVKFLISHIFEIKLLFTPIRSHVHLNFIMIW
jgi:hypothetical protein